MKRKLFLKTWRDIKKRKGEFTALVVLVSLGITSYVAFVSAYSNLSASADQANSELKLADFTVQVVEAPDSVARQIEDVPGVAAVQGRLVIDTGLDLDEETQVMARVVSIPDDDRPAVDDLLVESGQWPLPSDTEALVLKKFADDRGLGEGDSLDLWAEGSRHRIQISGTAASPEYIYPIRAKGEIPSPSEFVVLFMPQVRVEGLFGRQNSYNNFAVRVSEGENREAVIDRVESLLEPYRIEETVPQEDQPSNFALHEEIRQNQTFAYFMPLLILVISALSLFIALSRLVQSQRGEIGLAKALGYSNGQLLFHYLLFSVFIAAAGSILGFAIGEAFSWWITGLYTSLLGIPYLTNQIHPEVIVGSILMSGGSCVLAGIIPAYASARLLPVKAMHSDPNIAVSGGRIPLIEKALGPLLPRNYTFRIPFRNIFRARRRSIYTIIGIAFALILTISTWALFDTLNNLLDVQFNRAERWDVTAVFERNFSQETVDEVTGWDGVERVQTALILPVRLEAGGATHIGMMTAAQADQSFHGFDIIEGEQAEQALAAGGMIITPKLSQKLGVEVGDEIVVRSPYVAGKRMRLLAINDELWGSPIYVNAATGRELAGGGAPSYNAMYLDVDPAMAKAVKKQLYSLPGAATVLVKQSVEENIRGMFDFMYLFGGILLAFGFTMAFVVIYNTFTANILERTREIATMRTIGEDRLHLAAIVTLENLFLSVAGIPLGIVLGLWVTNALFDTLSTDDYTIRAVLNPVSYLWIILSILGVLLVSEILPIRRIFRLDLAEATKFIE